MITLGYLIEPLLIKEIKGEINTEITGISYDSRDVKEGDLFVCIPGYKFDGHDYANDAVVKGAKALIVEEWLDVKTVTQVKVSNSREALAILAAQFYNCPSKDLNLIGVTGTNGKTTVTHLINSIYSASYDKTGLIGTVRYKIGDEEYPVKTTTPESFDLQQMMASMVKKAVRDCVIEVSSHAIKQKRILGCDFNICVFTNLTQDHLDYHPSMDDYRAAKGRLFSFLGLSHKKNNIPKASVINIDDESAQYMMEQSAVQVITYGIYNDADIMAKNIEIFPEGCQFDVESPWGNFNLNIKLTGRFSIYNALAAVSVALLEGFNPNFIKEVLEKVEKVPGRFEKVDAGQNFLVIVDYAHTSDSLENVLSTLKEFTPGRIGVVFGCGGDRDKEKRPLMGKVAASYGDKLFITSDNPRTEDPEEIIKDIKKGLGDETSFLIEPDRKKAISLAVEWAKEGDSLLIAGKGHETYQVFKDKTVNFDDREVAWEEIVRQK
ncbi:UDP-N-acetylmuramoyl-L-alanyl-D-glutamate--2,6-diaminopimelate ligase [Natranaerofaba carboxydovora]|uniref:UDP-N-acetylmuramoyl-L-alanyl-D-glutamate--2, 6-diaminopimelate ligase n=1 Tax=Natranaerofaba carboxydovora TaxID=2742683 RepID=UPI001F12E03E|nr:UDP-N-acetylmuramoyl-L-alanyl-D-glutamate--2,6-diaminopimelate ligase [Natranaerofaba carboxydovora]UMZ73253.1 UDP-N-acetylmuramoyl-L-alanyl-D-glutamate--2,6-diaminopimelate ligase [Natranaerofaba carboxydovora]